MSNTSKVVWGVIIIVVIILGVWWITSPSSSSSPAALNTVPAVTGETPVSSPGQTTQTVTIVTSTSPTPASDTSDAAINQDASNVDAQMNSLNSDNSAADSGINNPSQ